MIRLGGSVLPSGEFWRIQTPDCLKVYPLVAPRYENVTFDRELATRTKKCELFGVGHPLIDALLSYLQNAPFSGDTACVPAASTASGMVEARYRVTWDRADETIRLWIASRKTELPPGTIPRCDLLGVSVST
ncbi:MAG: hypothetical protein WCI03_14545 [bacterium]